MKNRFLRFICLTLVFLMLVPALVACSEPQVLDASEDEDTRTSTNDTSDTMDAFALFEKIDEAMNDVSSYQLGMTMTAKFYMSVADAYVDVSMTGTEITSKSDNGDLYYLDETTTVMSFKINGSTQKNTAKNMMGFQDGKMFIMTDSGDSSQKVQKLYSEISASDYEKHRKSLDEKTEENDFDLSKDTCTNTECVFDDASKQWVATFRGFTEDGINKMDLGFSDIAAYMDEDYEFSDVVVKIAATEDYVLTKMTVEYEFKYLGEGLYNKELAPKISIDITCSGVNATERGKTVNFNGYTKVSDLRVLFDANSALDSRVEAKSGKFSLKSKILDGYGYGETETYTYNYYHDTQGKLSYTLNYTSDIGSSSVSYKNGTATVTYPGYPAETVESTDSVEYEGIQAFINYCDFSIGNVTNIQTIDAAKGKYRFIIGNVDMDLIEELELVENPKESSCSQYFDFTVKDGVLVSYEFKLTAVSYQNDTSSYTVTCTFS